MQDQLLLKEFGLRIRQLRLASGLSQEELAEQTGFHRTYIGMIERGERTRRMTERLRKIQILRVWSSVDCIHNFGNTV